MKAAAAAEPLPSGLTLVWRAPGPRELAGGTRGAGPFFWNKVSPGTSRDLQNSSDSIVQKVENRLG
jgi:hypothetical protein